jgi:hypothetical protein
MYGKYNRTYIDDHLQPCTPRRGPEGKLRGRPPDLTNDASTVSDSGRLSVDQVSLPEVSL